MNFSKIALALCATAAAGAVHAAPVIVDIPDTTLGDIQIDFDTDGNPELRLAFTQVMDGPYLNALQTFGNTAVVGYEVTPPATKPGTYASALAGGTTIDASLDFVTGDQVILGGKDLDTYGEFLDQGLNYLGVRFDIGGAAHFGWVELIGEGRDITVTRYGYNDEARAAAVTPGLVPEPGSLALLVAGAAGVLALRRRRNT